MRCLWKRFLVADKFLMIIRFKNKFNKIIIDLFEQRFCLLSDILPATVWFLLVFLFDFMIFCFVDNRHEQLNISRY